MFVQCLIRDVLLSGTRDPSRDGSRGPVPCADLGAGLLCSELVSVPQFSGVMLIRMCPIPYSFSISEYDSTLL